MTWPAPPPLDDYVLRLFVAGSTTRSQNAITNIRRICEQHLADRFELEVIDVYTHPQQTRDLQIVATPTLVRLEPKPLRRVVGDLTNRDRVLSVLGLLHPEGSSEAAT
ncbi:MAG: circadian clock KaiB family protein [Caulobacteraceae bacterium]